MTVIQQLPVKLLSESTHGNIIPVHYVDDISLLAYDHCDILLWPRLRDKGNTQIALKKKQKLIKLKLNNQRHKIYKDHRAAQAGCLL